MRTAFISMGSGCTNMPGPCNPASSAVAGEHEFWEVCAQPDHRLIAPPAGEDAEEDAALLVADDNLGFRCAMPGIREVRRLREQNVAVPRLAQPLGPQQRAADAARVQ